MKRIFICLTVLLWVVGSAAGAEVDLKEAWIINGVRQWVTVKGDDQHPIMLFLHGGPGNSVRSYAGRFTSKLADQFLIVHWDQRGAGKTASLQNDRTPLTTDLMMKDAIELIRQLRERYHKDKVILVGHSWGGFLALMVAGKAGDQLLACIAVCPMVWQNESEARSLGWMKEMKNPLAEKELEAIRVPFESADDLYLHRKWLAILRNEKPPDRVFVVRWAATNFQLFRQASNINLFEALPSLECPVYFLLGRNDHQTDSNLTEAYFQALKAGKKDLFWFNKSAHNVPLTEPETLQDTIITILTKH